MTEIHNSYPAGVSGSEKPDNAASRERKETDRRGFLIGLGLSGAALAVGAGLSAALFGHNRSSSASPETTPSPSESPSSSPEATPSATATEFTESSTPSQEPESTHTNELRPEPVGQYNFSNLNEFNDKLWEQYDDRTKGQVVLDFFKNNLNPDVIDKLVNWNAGKSQELADIWFSDVDPLIRKLTHDAKYHAKLTDDNGAEIYPWSLLNNLASYLDVPHIGQSKGYYGKFVDEAYQSRGQDLPNYKPTIFTIQRFATMSELGDRYPIDTSKTVKGEQIFSAVYCEVLNDRDGKIYDFAIRTQVQDPKTGRYDVDPFPRVAYFCRTDESNKYKPTNIPPLNEAR